jgi:hypothetical protein
MMEANCHPTSAGKIKSPKAKEKPMSTEAEDKAHEK